MVSDKSSGTSGTAGWIQRFSSRQAKLKNGADDPIAIDSSASAASASQQVKPDAKQSPTKTASKPAAKTPESRDASKDASAVSADNKPRFKSLWDNRVAQRKESPPAKQREPDAEPTNSASGSAVFKFVESGPKPAPVSSPKAYPVAQSKTEPAATVNARSETSQPQRVLAPWEQSEVSEPAPRVANRNVNSRLPLVSTPKPVEQEGWRPLEQGGAANAGEGAAHAVYANTNAVSGLRLETHGPQRVSVGQPVEYVFTVSNLNSSGVDDVFLEVLLPPKALLLEAAPAFEKGKTVWNVGRLEPNA
ncbi:MAG: hypothetical protein N2C14_12755, partial [Planctomycetales bacterium]